MGSSSPSSSFSSSASSSSSSSSSSTVNNPNICMHCNSYITTLVNGWPLGDGTVAQLCHRCGIFYQEGTFCETFHRNCTGWLECAVCLKKLHTNCIVSRSEVHFKLFGRLCCKVCAKKLIRR
ncbi:B3 domain-containing transcription repressor VAL1-like [Vigna umbellata]|uniref:B3 domain-containing transcription repressor VAL1-like n=1 Tax=Vigna umbellata TaxID=87088 RepID=UPI001F5F3906|nr:B3 domain-containing transcription repressor VAL1-like [Vigna umbellata]